MRKKTIIWGIVILLVGTAIAQIGLSNNIFDTKSEALTEYETQKQSVSSSLSAMNFDITITSDKVCDLKGDCVICFKYPDIANTDSKKPQNTLYFNECFHFSEESSKEQNFEEIRRYVYDTNKKYLENTILYKNESIKDTNFNIQAIQYNEPSKCVSEDWQPSRDEYCIPVIFVQTNSCGEQRFMMGIKEC